MPTLREIVDVKMDREVAELLAETYRTLGRKEVRVHKEKIRAERPGLWRWGWVIVADVRSTQQVIEEVFEPDILAPRKRRKVVKR